ncbi:MAG: hypothetical protein WCR42_13955 [bacterium]
MMKFRHLTLVISAIVLLGFTGCDNSTEPILGNKVLFLKVDFETNTFEGGKELTFAKETETFTITNIYVPPGDFGSVKLMYSELNDTLFYGTIWWMGKGEMTYPKELLPADKFQVVLTEDYVTPKAGFQNVFKPYEGTYDYTPVWSSVQNLVKVRQYLRSNPNATVKLFLYQPSVGVGDPADWDWILFLKS